MYDVRLHILSNGGGFDLAVRQPGAAAGLDESQELKRSAREARAAGGAASR